VATAGLAHSVGSYLQLVVCNRAHAPCAKLRLREWYEKTALQSALAIPAADLDHRRTWDAMDQLPEAAIEQIEQALCRRLVERGALGADEELLVFDPTNLYAFIASSNARDTIARRGAAAPPLPRRPRAGDQGHARLRPRLPLRPAFDPV